MSDRQEYSASEGEDGDSMPVVPQAVATSEDPTTKQNKAKRMLHAVDKEVPGSIQIAEEEQAVLRHAPHSLEEPFPEEFQLPPSKEDSTLIPTSDFIHGEGKAPRGSIHYVGDENVDERTRLLAAEEGGVVVDPSVEPAQDPEEPAHYRTLGDEIPPLRRVIFVTMPIFSGYASLITFQSRLKEHMGIVDKHSSDSYIFGVALSMFFLGALLFRFMHNVFLGFLTPRRRIYVAQILLASSLWMITIVYYIVGSKHLVPVFFAYICGGMAVGTFESAFISVITPLGHVTKKWALYGMPLGYNGFAVSGFLLLAAIPTDPLLQGIAFGIIGAFNLLGLCIFFFLVPDTPFEASEESFISFLKKLQHWRQWVPIIWKNMACMFVNMFTVILGSSLILYIFGSGDVAIVPDQDKAMVPTNVFQALTAFCSFSGDFLSRRLAYDPPSWYPRKIMLASARTGNPIRFLVLNIVGFGFCVSNIALLAPIGMFFIMFGNGSVYSTTTRLIDNHVENQFNLAAVSVFLFIGDSGSYVASLVITPILNLL